MLNLEIKKIVKRREFLFFFFVMFLAVVSDFVINCYNSFGSSLSVLYPASVMTVLDNISRAPFRTVYGLFLPFVVCFVASDTYLLDKKYGINNYILCRVNRKQYIWNKAKAIFIVVSVTISINILLSILLSRIAFPAYGYSQFGTVMPYELTDRFESKNLLYNLELYHPYINIAFWGIMRGIIGGIFALIAYGISFIKGINRYVVLVSGFIFYNFYDLLQQIAEKVLEHLDLTDTFLSKIIYGAVFTTNPRVSVFGYVKDIIIYLIVALLLIHIGTKREEV